MSRTSSGLALLTAGAVMLLTVMIPGAPFSIKFVGVFLVAAGLLRLRLPRRVTEWLHQNKERMTEAVDPGAAIVAQAPRVPLDDLLASRPAGAATDKPVAEPPADGTAIGQEN